MAQSLDDLLALYDYKFPAELIANEPAHPRDAARLLIYNRHPMGVGAFCQNAPTQDGVAFDIFRNITDYLPKNAVLVFNKTKVIPARMRLTKETGGTIDALYLGVGAPCQGAPTIQVMAPGKMQADDRLQWNDHYSFRVTKRDGKYAELTPSFPMTDLHALLERYGETPLPPYIKDSPLSETERRSEYQTVYAKDAGSVAAPTAGLHFTPELLKKIEEHGCSIAYVTLHVNLGTFAPVTEEHFKQKKLHEEWYEIDAETAAFLNMAKVEDRPIIAVGTTSVRTLESATVNHRLTRLSAVTDIFLTEEDHLQFVDGLITNFHVPRSSLLMLVSALTGREKLMDLYQQAIDKQFRLFSFGDGMMIL